MKRMILTFSLQRWKRSSLDAPLAPQADPTSAKTPQCLKNKSFVCDITIYIALSQQASVQKLQINVFYNIYAFSSPI